MLARQKNNNEVPAFLVYTHMCPNVLMLHTLDHDLHLHFLQSNAQLLSEIATTKHNQQSKQIERKKW